MMNFNYNYKNMTLNYNNEADKIKIDKAIENYKNWIASEKDNEILNKIWDPIMFFSNIQLDESEWDWYTENIDWIEYYVDNKTWAKTKIMSSEEAKEVNKVLTSEKKLSSDEYIELNTKIQILEQQISNKTFVLNENIFSPLIFIIALSIINILWFIYIYFRMKK